MSCKEQKDERQRGLEARACSQKTKIATMVFMIDMELYLVQSTQ